MYVLQTKGHGWSYKWLQVFSDHYFTNLLDLGLHISSMQFFAIDLTDDGYYYLCIAI